MRVLPYHLPLVAERGAGSRLWDADGNEYIDLNMAYGPLIFGHCPPQVIEAVTRQIRDRGSILGFPTEIGFRVAEKIKQLFPAMELMRFANSGTEAVASSIRLARTYTGRSQIVLFEGHYHGWSDSVFHRYHAPLDELSRNGNGNGAVLPGTQGMNGAPSNVLLLPWNDLDALEACLNRHSGEVAAVIMEPIMGNSGLIPPEPGFLQGVREATLNHDVLLIFDEVITGLRVAAGGASEYYLVTPDITVLSKALGGGYALAAFGAARSMMELIARGELFHGGVFSGNATTMAAAEAVLDTVLDRGPALYASLHEIGDRLANGLRDVMGHLGVPHVVQSVGPTVSLFLTDGKTEKLTGYRDVRRHCDMERYIVLQHAMQRRGVYFHPNQFETMFLSTAHTAADIDVVLERFEDGVRSCFLN